MGKDKSSKVATLEDLWRYKDFAEIVARNSKAFWVLHHDPETYPIKFFEQYLVNYAKVIYAFKEQNKLFETQYPFDEAENNPPYVIDIIVDKLIKVYESAIDRANDKFQSQDTFVGHVAKALQLTTPGQENTMRVLRIKNALVTLVEALKLNEILEKERLQKPFPPYFRGSSTYSSEEITRKFIQLIKNCKKEIENLDDEIKEKLAKNQFQQEILQISQEIRGFSLLETGKNKGKCDGQNPLSSSRGGVKP